MVVHRKAEEEEEELKKETLQLKDVGDPNQTTKENLEGMDPVEGTGEGREQKQKEEEEEGQHSNSNCSPKGRWQLANMRIQLNALIV